MRQNCQDKYISVSNFPDFIDITQVATVGESYQVAIKMGTLLSLTFSFEEKKIPLFFLILGIGSDKGKPCHLI